LGIRRATSPGQLRQLNPQHLARPWSAPSFGYACWMGGLPPAAGVPANTRSPPAALPAAPLAANTRLPAAQAWPLGMLHAPGVVGRMHAHHAFTRQGVWQNATPRRRGGLGAGLAGDDRPAPSYRQAQASAEQWNASTVLLRALYEALGSTRDSGEAGWQKQTNLDSLSKPNGKEPMEFANFANSSVSQSIGPWQV